MQRKNKGFTLIELLVVIAIIAVLMGILMPAIQRVRKQARGIACRANLKSWGTMFNMYTSEHDGKFMTRYQSIPAGVKASHYGRWFDSMIDYYKSAEDIRMCPVVKKLANPYMEEGVWGRGDTFTGWGKTSAAGSERIGVYGSYGMNGWCYKAGNDTLYGKEAKYHWGSMNVPGTSQIPMFMDCWFWVAWPEYTDQPPKWGPGEGPDGKDWQVQNDKENSMNRVAIDRHNGSINMVFMDGHVDPVRLKKLWGLKWHRDYNINGPYTEAGGIKDDDWPEWMRGM